MKRVKIGNALIDNVSYTECIDIIKKKIHDHGKMYVVTPNVDHIVKLNSDKMFASVYREAGLVVADGMPLIWASKLLKTPIKERICGSDLFPDLCALASEKQYRLFFLGGLEGVAHEAASKLRNQFEGIKIEQIYSPPFGFEDDEAESRKIIDMINEVQPHILFIGVGAPKQEKWLYNNFKHLNINVGIGIGASFDFVAGNIKRAPVTIQNLGLEWFWRFLQEPRRLFRRYFVEDMQFLSIIFKQYRGMYFRKTM